MASDRFELLEELGCGATGTVWRAQDKQRGAQVALKVLHHFDIGVVRRFKHEFRTLADVRHRNVVRLFELLETDDRLFFSMELIEGVDVLCWIWGFDPSDRDDNDCAFDEDTKPNALTVTGPIVDEHRLRAVFGQLVEGLLHVHDAGYLHRDLKPPNLIVDRDGHLRILDFGLAASLLAPRAHELETAVGTIAYMAPEIAELRTATARSDYYSIGVLLYEALTGRVPFAGNTVAEILAAKATQEPPAPSAAAPNVPADLDALCRRLLARDPAQRASADELRRAFGVGRHRRGARTAPSEPPARGSGAIAPLPMVGRSREIDALLGDLGRAHGYGFQCRIVVGPSGIGKSALADAFGRRASSAAVVLMGRCHDREAIPFRAVDEVVDALSYHLSTLRDRELAALLAEVPTAPDALCALFPVLRSLMRGQPTQAPERQRAATDPGVSRTRAFAALRELLSAVARSAPTAIVIDDLHLADPDSLDLLQQVFRGRDAPPVLVVGLARPGSVVDALCAQAVRPGPHLRVDLSPLEGEEAELAARSLATRLGVPLDDARALAIDAGGHPGFMYEILRRADPDDECAGRSLPSLTAAIGGAIAGISDLGRRVLELSALAEGVCSVDVAAEVLGASTCEIAVALDALVDGNLLVATGRGRDDVFEVYHERIRDVALAAIDEREATRLYTALAQAIERRDPDAASMVRLWTRAEDRVRAASWRTTLAEQAVATFELRRAALLHEQSLADELPLPLERRVRGALAQVYGFLGRHTDAAAQHMAAARLASGDEAIAAKHRAAEELLAAAAIDAGGRAIEDVLAELGQSSPSGRAGQLLALAGHAVAAALPTPTFRPREELNSHAALIVDALATAATRVGVLDPWRSRVYQRKHLRAAQSLGDPARYGRALAAEAVWCAAGGQRRSKRVAALLIAARAVTPRGSHLTDGRAALAEALASLLVADLPRARTAIDHALASLLRCGAGAWWETRQAQSTAGWIYWMQGDLAALGGAIDAWTYEARQRQDELTLAMLTTAAGVHVSIARDDAAGAEASLAAAESNWALQHVAPWRWHAAAARVDLELYRGAWPQALAVLDDAEAAARRAGLGRVQILDGAMRHLRLRVLLTRVAATQTPQERDELCRRIDEQCAQLGAIDAGWTRALALLGRAALLDQRGQAQQALAFYRRAEQALTATHLCGYATAARWRIRHLAGATNPLDDDGHLPPAAARPRRYFPHLLACPDNR